jgi:SAM-dependent methyltransferase
MSDRVYAIHTDEECERLEAQALLASVSDHVRHIPAQPGMRILDAGCGSGSMAREIAKAAPGSVVVGIDLRDKYAGYARRRAEAEGLRNLTFETGDVRELPFADGAFDIIWTKYLLQWVVDPMRAMHEFAPAGYQHPQMPLPCPQLRLERNPSRSGRRAPLAGPSFKAPEDRAEGACERHSPELGGNNLNAVQPEF